VESKNSVDVSPFSASALVVRSWTLRDADGNPAVKGLRLVLGGSFSEDAPPGNNIQSWTMRDDCLAFLEQGGFVCVKFSVWEWHDDGTIILKGRWRREVLRERWFTLEEEKTPVQDLLARFESLGNNCEFGLVQRYYGLEVLGIFRFTSTHYRNLVTILESKLEALDRPDQCEVILSPRKEYVFRINHLNMSSHTDRFEKQISKEKMMEMEMNKLRFLRRKFGEELNTGGKIFVRKGEQLHLYKEVEYIYQLLRNYGHNNLLWVVLSDADHPSGTVEILNEGFYRGYIDRFAPYDNATRIFFDSWLRLCRNVIRTVSEPA